jgi:hypothetical protein
MSALSGSSLAAIVAITAAGGMIFTKAGEDGWKGDHPDQEHPRASEDRWP